MKHKLLWATLVLIGAASVAASAGVLLRNAPADKATAMLAISAAPTRPAQARPAPARPARAKASVPGPAKVRKVKMTVTAYCPCPICCDYYARVPLTLRRLAGGDRLAPLLRDHAGFVAGPANLPFGTEVSIPGYHEGQYVAVLDRGGAIVGNHVDVFMSNHRQAVQWGKQTLLVTVREKGNQQ